MNVAQLKLALQIYGLTVDGLKGDLQARLNAHLRLHEESTSDGVATLHPSSEPTNTQKAPTLNYRHHNEIKVDWRILSISTFDSLKKRKGLPPFQIKNALRHPLLWGGGGAGEGFRGCCSVGEATTVSSFVASCG